MSASWNPPLPISYDRHFQLWLYTASLGRVVLRSFRRDEGPATSIEVMFQDVKAMQLRQGWEKLTLRTATDEEAGVILGSTSGPWAAWQPQFIVLGEGLQQGWVVCGAFGTAENDLDYTYMPELVSKVG